MRVKREMMERLLKFIPWCIAALAIGGSGIIYYFWRDTEHLPAIAAYLAFVSTILIAGITYLYVLLTDRLAKANEELVKSNERSVENARKNVDLLREQWDKEREVRPNFWIEVDHSRVAAEFHFRSEGRLEKTRIVPCNIKVWNCIVVR